MRRDRVAIDALGFLGIPFDETEPVIDLTHRFGEALAVFLDHDFGEHALVVADQFEPPAQQIATLLGQPPGPGRKGLAGPIDSGLDLRTGELRRFAGDRAVGWIDDLDHVFSSAVPQRCCRSGSCAAAVSGR